MFNILKRIIEKKYYENREDIELKVNVFFGYSVISATEYADLMELIEANYTEVEEEIEEENQGI